jgi:hypothetical protein
MQTQAAPQIQDQLTIIREIRDTLDLLFPAGAVFEVRALGVSTPDWRAPHTEHGYFDDHGRGAHAAAECTPCADGVYVTLNHVRPELLHRAHNRMRAARAGSGTADSDIVRLRWLLVDADLVRPAGIPSTDVEHARALQVVRAVRRFLVEDLSWPPGVLADSGNGGHYQLPLDLAPDRKDVCKQVLEAIALRFSTPEVSIDRTTWNPARITKLYGTLARKGDDTAERPHRRSRLQEAPQ